MASREWTMASQRETSDVVVLSKRLGPPGEEDHRVEEIGATIRSAALWTLDDIRRNSDASAFILGAVEPFDTQALAAVPRCRAIIRRGVGHDNIDVAAATRLGIPVANVPGASTEEVAEHALALLLALERRILSLNALVHAHVWGADPSALAPTRAGIRRLSELTLGIVGFGRIGRALAAKASPLYARIAAVDPTLNVSGEAVEAVTFDALLTRADHISLHLPLTPDTQHLINAGVLGRLRPGAMLVNTSRGGLIDERALLHALDKGTLSGAALDVTEQEPINSASPLLDRDDLLLTAHSAYVSTAGSQDVIRRSVDAAISLLVGHHPEHLLNPEVLNSPALRIPTLRDRLKARWEPLP